jgi:putative two-component system response regulator
MSSHTDVRLGPLTVPLVDGLPELGTAPEPLPAPADVRTMKILVADDSPFNVALLTRVLGNWGFENVRSTTRSADVAGLMDTWKPDLLMLDLQMPAPDGFQIMRDLVGTGDPVSVPILVLTADTTIETRRRALSLGATDFTCKPFDFEEVCLRARNMLTVRRAELRLEDQNANLERMVAERTEALGRAHLDMLRHLAIVAEYRDEDTHLHTERVGNTAALLAAALGIAEDQVDLVRQAAQLHDIGKVAIPDEILLKPGPLTPAEFEIVKTHTTAGARILAGAESEPLKFAETVALTHHERWDGTGYPSGLAGTAIPLISRLVAVADVFDALTHSRPYKQAMPLAEALSEMRRHTGTHFDPAVFAAFETLDHRALVGDVDDMACEVEGVGRGVVDSSTSVA